METAILHEANDVLSETGKGLKDRPAAKIEMELQIKGIHLMFKEA